MSLQDDLTTLVCLFHHQDRAQAVMNDLNQAGVPQSAVTLIGGPNSAVDALEKSNLASLGMPDKDYDHLKDGIRDGGVVVAVAASSTQADTIEDIFKKHSVTKIDEVERAGQESLASAAPVAAAPLAAQAVNAETAIPIVEEELVVGKRAVNQGGVRVYRRVVEVPVEESVNLREEHVTMERHAVNRAVTDTDAFRDRTIELTETAEEAVVGKNARVVEELLVGKTSSQHTEMVRDTVRKTEVEVEEIPGSGRDVDATRRTS